MQEFICWESALGPVVDKCHEVAVLFCPPITELMLTLQSNKTSANADRQISFWPKGHTHTDGYIWMYKHQKRYTGRKILAVLPQSGQY